MHLTILTLAEMFFFLYSQIMNIRHGGLHGLLRKGLVGNMEQTAKKQKKKSKKVWVVLGCVAAVIVLALLLIPKLLSSLPNPLLHMHPQVIPFH